MYLKSFLFLTFGLFGLLVMPLPNQANAATPLTRAQIQNLQNLVQLLPRNNKKRPARKLDSIVPGDGLATGRSSLADLRFNDGSLARVGERALFQFLPQTRNFRLSNGTVLLLIPPGRGQTRIQTPSAAAAIRGSALFVRYDQQTDTTVVGALTNSGIEVFNREGSQSQVLAAGQLMVIVKGQFQGLYDFDLKTFYKTSDLVQGLNLTKESLTPNPDPAIASVQAETAAALAVQLPVVGQDVIENPSFLELSANSSNSTNQSTAADNSPVNSLVETGQFLPDTIGEPKNNNDNVINTDQPIPHNNPGNNPGGNPGNPTDHNPGNNPGGNPGNPTDHNPGNNPGGNPGNPTDHNPGNNPGDNPGNPTDNNPGGNPGNPTDHNPGNNPGGNPGNPTDHNPGNNPGGNPGNPTDHNPGNNPGGNPGNPTDHNPGNNPGGNPGNPTDHNPANNPGGNPGNPTDHNPANNPGGNPGNPTDHNPANNPGGNPGNSTDHNPGNNPGGNPGNPTDHNPGNNPGDNPGNPTDHNPGNNPGGNPTDNSSGHDPQEHEYPAP